MHEDAPNNTLRIGSIQLASKAVLAPLAGYTDLTYRTICRRLGARYAATEVTLDSSINLSPRLRGQLIQISCEDHPLAGQIMGREPKSMATAAAHLVRMGCDVIDLNFACPVRKALRRGRGGHMMRDPEIGVAVIQAVAEQIEGVPLTIKLRQSFYNAPEGEPGRAAQADAPGDEPAQAAQATASENAQPRDAQGEAAAVDTSAFYRMIDAAFEAGFAAACVHGRTVECGYSGPADWAFLAEVKRRYSDRVIIGSGDLHTADDGVRMLRETGVDGVSFARGALGNPWIFAQFDDLMAGRPAREIPLAEQARVLREHAALCRECFGDRRGAKLIYRFAIRYSKMHPRPKAVRSAVTQAPMPLDIERLIAEFYED